MSKSNTGFSPESLRLIGAALALHQVECISASITPLPGTGRFIAIGTPAEVARLLEIAPATPSSDDARNAALEEAASVYMVGAVAAREIRKLKSAAAQSVGEKGSEA